MAAEQRKCGLRKGESEAHLIESPIDSAGTTLLCDVSTDKTRPIVPESLRRQVFDSIHSLSHPGVRASIKLIADRYTWSGMKKDIRNWVQSCNNKTYHLTNELLAKPYHTGNDDRDKTNLKQ